MVQKRLIVRGEPITGNDIIIPKINSWVVDQKRNRIGKVFDFFGPIKHPYIIVRPNKGIDAAAHVGQKLYFDEAPGRDEKWKKLKS